MLDALPRPRSHPATVVGVIDKLRVAPGDAAGLADRPTDDKVGLTKAAAQKRIVALTAELDALQSRFAAEATGGLLVVVQAMDAGGKDGTIRTALGGLNPQGVRVVSFKAPAGREASQDYLWRVHNVCPGKGEIAIFNRSHYEDVLVVRVHELVPEQRWRARYRHIREFERLLHDEGTTIVKFMLHISADEQRARLQDRIDDPTKRWKFRVGDLDDRKKWDDFQAAYEEALTETSTDEAPWYVIPADRNWARDVAVLQVLVHTLEKLDPQYPKADPAIIGLKVV
jgi:PPK2 family polyphosphate:nucleotide phosphotransferase